MIKNRVDMSGRPITDQDKLACAERELKMRHKVYPNRIRHGRMQPSEADREIEIMEAIIADYREKVQPSISLLNADRP